MANLADNQSPKPGPNPAPNPFTKPPANDGIAPATSPVAVPPIEIDPAAGQKKKVLFIVLGCLIFLGLIALIPTLILQSQLKKPRYTPTPTPEVINNKGPKVDASARSAIGAHVFIKATQTLRTAYDINMKVPTAWNASFSVAPTSNYPWESGLTVTALSSGYSPLSSANPATKSANYMTIMDLSDWLKTDRNSYQLDATKKQAWFDSVKNLSAESINSAASSIINPRIANEPGGHQRPIYVASQDKLLHGYAYLTLLNEKSYDPQIIITLVGSFEKRPVVLYGVHAVRDKDWARLTNLQASNDNNFNEELIRARNSFKSGALADDTKSVQDELVEALKTITILKTGQEAGTPQP